MASLRRPAYANSITCPCLDAVAGCGRCRAGCSESRVVQSARADQGRAAGGRQILATDGELWRSAQRSAVRRYCAGTGRGRWADARNWLYDFEHDLPAGIECSFKTKAGLKTFAGVEVAAQTFRFSTGGPSIRGAWPDEGEERIDEAQVFTRARCACRPASVRANAYCAVDGIGERLPLNILEGKERERILAEQKNRARVLFGVITKRGKRGLASVKDVRLVDAPILVAVADGVAGGRACAARLGRGIKTTSGIATTRTLPYQVRPQFSARFTCQRVNANAGCIPVLPAARVHRASRARHRIEDRIACSRRASTSPDDRSQRRHVDSVEFKGRSQNAAKRRSRCLTI